MIPHRMKRFEVFVGTWNTTGEVHATEQSPATTLVATDTYRWLPGGHFLIHEVDARFGSQPSRSLEIVGFDTARRKYLSRSYDDRGAEEKFEIILRGRRYHILGQTVRFAGQFNAEKDVLQGVWELRSTSSWKPWIKIKLARAG